MYKLVQAVFAAFASHRHVDSDGNDLGYSTSDIVKCDKHNGVWTSTAKLDGQELQFQLNGRKLQVLPKVTVTGKPIRLLQLATPSTDKELSQLDCIQDAKLDELHQEADPNEQLAVWVGDMNEQFISCTFLIAVVRAGEDGQPSAYIQKFWQQLETTAV